MSKNLAKKELAKRELAKRRLIRFVEYNFPNYDANWHHHEIAEKLEAIERGEIKRLMIFMPPRHGKSMLGSVYFPAWYLGKHPEREIIATSYAADLATHFGRQTRNLVRKKEFQNVFKISLAADSKSVQQWNTEKDGAYIAAGVGGAITGKGAHILIIDDPIKTREDAESELHRDKVDDWYRSTAITRLYPNAAVIVIQTRWHDDDLAGRLIERDKNHVWDILSYPAIAEADEEHRKKGEPLWPGYYDVKDLLEKKEDVGPYEWSAQYQQDPVDEGSQEFKQDWFKYRTWEDVQKLSTRNFLSIDTAISQKASADYTGWSENFVDNQGKWNLRSKKMRINPGMLINMLFESYAKHNWEKIGIEKTIYYDTMKEFLDKEMVKRDVYLPIYETHHEQTRKETRIRGLIPRYSRGGVYHVKDETETLEKELLRFPKAKHDDESDALAYQLQLSEGLFFEGDDEDVGADDDFLRVDYS